ncbi:MAG TPA: 6-phosphogluconolactonase [Candidatus Eisenbacteria bacterium]
MGELRVFETRAALAQAAAGKIAQRIAAGVGLGGRFRIALSGGSTPVDTYRALARGPWVGRQTWRGVEIYFVDERAVPPDDPASNYRMARETLIDPAAIPPANVHRIRAEEADLETVARQYAMTLPPAPDLLVLGIGEDGHTASIFPHSPEAREVIARVVVVRDSPKPPPTRVTITPRVLREAREIMVLATGAAKAPAVASALEGTTDPDRTPARLVREREWLIDREAAVLLHQPGEPRRP